MELLRKSCPPQKTVPPKEPLMVLMSGSLQSQDPTIFWIKLWLISGAFRKLLLYSPASEIGICIPYPTIALHAIQSLPAPAASEQQGLYMQLLLNSTDPEAGEDDDEADSISLTIMPQNDAPPPPTTTDPDNHTGDHSPQPPTVAMFTALSNCSNLHPDRRTMTRSLVCKTARCFRQA